MGLRCAALCALGLAVLGAADAGLSDVRNVYLLPMGSGLDQYIASKLTNSGLYQVVTDPEQADALFTDRIGMEFESRLEELYPPPQPAKPADEAKTSAHNQNIGMALGETASSGPRQSSFSRGRGNVFLVDRQSRRVLWSTYLRGRNTLPDEMNRVADRIVERLESDVKREVKGRRSGSVAAPVAPVPVPVPAPAAPAAPAPGPAPAAPVPAVGPVPAPAPEPAAAPAAPAPAAPAAPAPAQPK